MPEGVGFKGGAARAIAALTLFGEQLDVRDVDLCSINPEVDPEIIRALECQLMPDDISHGHGTEFAEDVDELVSDRDFTINEFAYLDGNLYFTEEGFSALRDKTIAVPGTGIYNEDNPWPHDAKLCAKSVLFAAVLKNQGFEPTIKEPLDQYTSPFWAAVMLSRAMEVGPMVADEFARNIVIRAYDDDDEEKEPTEHRFKAHYEMREWLDGQLYNFGFSDIDLDFFNRITEYTDDELEQMFNQLNAAHRTAKGAHWLVEQGWA